MKVWNGIAFVLSLVVTWVVVQAILPRDSVHPLEQDPITLCGDPGSVPPSPCGAIGNCQTFDHCEQGREMGLWDEKGWCCKTVTLPAKCVEYIYGSLCVASRKTSTTGGLVAGCTGRCPQEFATQ